LHRHAESQPADTLLLGYFRGEMIVTYLLLYLRTKPDFENFGGGNCLFRPAWLRTWSPALATWGI